MQRNWKATMTLAEQLINQIVEADLDKLAQEYNGRFDGTAGRGPSAKDVYFFAKEKEAKDFAAAAKKKGAKTSMRKPPSGKGYEVIA